MMMTSPRRIATPKPVLMRVLMTFSRQMQVTLMRMKGSVTLANGGEYLPQPGLAVQDPRSPGHLRNERRPATPRPSPQQSRKRHTRTRRGHAPYAPEAQNHERQKQGDRSGGRQPRPRRRPRPQRRRKKVIAHHQLGFSDRSNPCLQK